MEWLEFGKDVPVMGIIAGVAIVGLIFFFFSSKSLE